MIKKTKKLIIFGNSGFSEIAYEYFEADSTYKVCAFTAEKKFLRSDNETLFNLPVVAFEEVEKLFPPDEYEIFIAITYSGLNRLRRKFIHEAELKGYRLASYVNSKVHLWSSIKTGKHCFVLENNVLQPFCKIGDGVILWSGNHIGHHSQIGDYVFVSSHVVISGYSKVGENSFLGVNSSIGDGVVIGRDNWLSPGVVLTTSTEDDVLWKSSEQDKSRVTSTKFFRVKGQ